MKKRARIDYGIINNYNNCIISPSVLGECC